MDTPQITNLVMLAAIVVVFYMFFIRPQAQKQKKQVSFLGELKKGDNIVTSSGILGTITKMDDNTVTIKVSEKSVLTVLKSTVSKELTDQLGATE